MQFFVKFISLLSLISFANADQKLITRQYSAEAVYYIPDSHTNSKHPDKPFGKDSLKDPFDLEIMKRLLTYGITFPEGSSVKIHQKTKSFEMVNTEGNHEILNYLVQHHLIFNSDIRIKGKLELYEVNYNNDLLMKPSEVSLDLLSKKEGFKKVQEISLEGRNKHKISAKHSGLEIEIFPEINAQNLKGGFGVNLSLNEGQKSNGIQLQTSLQILANKPSIIQLWNNTGKKIFYAFLTFKFLDKGGNDFTPLKVTAPKLKRGNKNVRLYHITKEVDWSLSNDLIGGINGPKWNPFIRTLSVISSEEKIKITDKLVEAYLIENNHVHFSGQIIEIKGDLKAKDRYAGIRWEDIEAVPEDKRKVLTSFSSQVSKNKKLILRNSFANIEKEDEEFSIGEKLEISFSFYRKTVSVWLKYFRNPSRENASDALSIETSFTSYLDSKLILQIHRNEETNRFLVLYLGGKK